MKDIFRTKSQKLLDAEIERLVEKLSDEKLAPEEYAKIVDNVKLLCEAREKKNPLQVNMDTLVAVGANLIGLVIVLNFEKTNILTSKAFSMIWKSK